MVKANDNLTPWRKTLEQSVAEVRKEQQKVNEDASAAAYEADVKSGKVGERARGEGTATLIARSLASCA